MVRNLLKFLIIVLVLTALGFWVFKYKHNDEKGVFVTPNQAEVGLTVTLKNNTPTPAIHITAGGTTGCDGASEIITTEQAATTGGMVIKIQGYQYYNPKHPDGCLTVALPIETTIPIENYWFNADINGKVTIILKDKENSYLISKNNSIYELTSVNISNVKPDQRSKVTVFPSDVGRLYIAAGDGDRVGYDDYKDRLIQFTRTKNLIPANEKYPEIKQDKLQELYVIVTDQKIPKSGVSEPSVLMGKLPGRNISVYLSDPIY